MALLGFLRIQLLAGRTRADHLPGALRLWCSLLGSDFFFFLVRKEKTNSSLEPFFLGQRTAAVVAAGLIMIFLGRGICSVGKLRLRQLARQRWH